MDNLENEYSGVDPLWQLERLYEELKSIKGRALSPRERMILRALLCCVPPKQLSEKMGWTQGALKTQMSNTIYRYLKGLLDVEKLMWHEIPELLKEKGYMSENSSCLYDSLESISSRINVKRALDIISAIESRIVDILDFNDSATMSDEVVDSFKKNAESCIEQGDNQEDSEKALKFYQEAFYFYVLIAEQCPSENQDIFVAIAQTYKLMDCYSDVVPMALFSLNHVEEDRMQAKLYHLVAIAYDELYRRSLNSGFLTEAIHFYDEARRSSKSLNSVILWNKFDLLNYAVSKKEFLQIDKAKIAFNDFENSATNPCSNFNSYSDLIIPDMINIKGSRKSGDWFFERIQKFLDGC